MNFLRERVRDVFFVDSSYAITKARFSLAVIRNILEEKFYKSTETLNFNVDAHL